MRNEPRHENAHRPCGAGRRLRRRGRREPRRIHAGARPARDV